MSLSLILQEEGQTALDLEILREYENGNFQKGNNKYTTALTRLRHMPEYKGFDWRLEGTENKRESPEFTALLLRALMERNPRDKFIIKQDLISGPLYFWKLTRRHGYWTANKAKAKIFRWQKDAEDMIKCFTGSEQWQVTRI